ncbi:MAG: nucleotidyltransferase [Clostridiales bacterium]|nr:nucleotidyltransferase [Clostridiales bacterium]
MKKTLAILAAGIGSRFGGGIKQLEPVGPCGEIIIDYSIHDAIKAGFNKIVFIIRKAIYADFEEMIGGRIRRLCEKLDVETEYAFQEIENIPCDVPEGRTKPWGTGQAVLACKGIIREPFAVINADDYYGKHGFAIASRQLEKGTYAMVGYILGNTLSDNGGVTRGICRRDESGALIGIDETKDIVKAGEKALANGKLIDIDSLASMNFWCFPASFIDEIETGFAVFLKNMSNPLKDEYLLPTIVDGLIKRGEKVDVLPTDDKWFGVTYREDKPVVVESFRRLYAKGEYSNELYSDIIK